MRKTICAVTFAAMISGVPYARSEPLCGDVNDSGTVSSGDALLVLRDAVGQDVTLMCTPCAPDCGNGIVESGEDCDAGSDLDATCETLGLAGGKLRCGTGCLFDKAGCYGARFTETAGTIIDRETGLEWEKKTMDGSVHDVGYFYTWRNSFTLPDGSAFTNFLAELNGAFDAHGGGGSCFQNKCDWRLPSIAELETIAVLDGSCTTSPCVVDPVFLPTFFSNYWSSSTYGNPTFAWTVEFAFGNKDPRIKATAYPCRAVRYAL